MNQKQLGSRCAWRKRALSLLLAALMVLGFFPGLGGADSGASAHWADPYLSQLAEWGFIRQNQMNNPDRALTRADFMSIVNKAYNYHELGEIPFEDVQESDWFFDDVSIAYTAKYILGTSPTTASPNSPLTRETAATILGRNMMLEESPGALVEFTDSNRISTWAMGTIKSALEHYLVSGYSDGSFRPQRNVSWGEMASMITNLIGTPLQEPGDYSLGGVFGNVTITSPNVTLRDTVISGDLYISGGVGLGGIKLENVTVLGRIIVCGTGNSETGEASVLLRNVTADEMIIDNLQGNFVSVQADGITQIGRTTVRTSAYIEDNTPEGMGLQYISLEGDSYPEGEEPEGWEPPLFQLAGRIKEVVNRTPNSTVQVGRGTVEKLTVDEAAAGSNVIIDRGAVVKELCLDTGTIVTGGGDIEHLIVNAPGCEVEMLPDEITIRPGITAIIAGEEMDAVAAEEASMEPLILAGYPQAQDIVPNGLDAAFMTNKAGTVYWAVSTINDGSIGEDDLIKPPSYGFLAAAHGSLAVANGNVETIAKVTGLAPGESYYLSAILVDNKGNRSPVKVISFTTPDNTIPAFCAGYPHMSDVACANSVAVAMPNKTCKMYYALLPASAVTPTENELRVGSVSGALGYGVMDVTKNKEVTFVANDVRLEEQTDYVLYLWLVDADGVNKGQIVRLPFKTADETPPWFVVPPTVNRVQATSVGLNFQLNEDGMVYWVAIPIAQAGKYPKPEPGTDYEFAPQSSMYGKLQIENGMNLGAGGKAGSVRASELTNGTINVTGLDPESAYVLFYIAKDTAGNYTEIWDKVNINTLDINGPKVTQSFSKTSGLDKTKDPLSSTDIYLDFSEDVCYTGSGGGKSFLELYQAVKNSNGADKQAINLLASNLYGAIKIHKIQDGSEVTVGETHDTGTPFAPPAMTIDYTKATVEVQKNGTGIRVTFPSIGLYLENGAEYYFTVESVADVSNNQNNISPDPVDFKNYAAASAAGGHDLWPFIVEFAKVKLTGPVAGPEEGPYARDKSGRMLQENGEYVLAERDMGFLMTPVSTSSVSNSICYDILLWSDSTLTYKLYYRVLDERNGATTFEAKGDGTAEYKALTFEDGGEEVKPEDYLIPQPDGAKGNSKADANGWIYLGYDESMTTNRELIGMSVNQRFNNCKNTNFPRLNRLNENLRYEFVIALDTFGEDAARNDRDLWTGEVNFYVNVAAGQSYNLNNLAKSPSSDWKDYKAAGLNNGAKSIGEGDTGEDLDTKSLYCRFVDSNLPVFRSGMPNLEDVTASSVSMQVALKTPGWVYYVIGEANYNNSGRAQIATTRYILDEDEEAAEKGGVTISRIGSEQMNVTLDGPNPPKDKEGSTSESMLNWMKGTGEEENVQPPVAEDSTSDIARYYNQLTAPKKGQIFNPKDLDEGANVISGSVHSDGFSTDPVVVDGLKPDTDYFAYFVIKGESREQPELSHIYIYHFKTEKPKLPRVDLEGERVDQSDGKGGKETVKTGNVVMEIDAVTVGKYQVFTQEWVLDPNNTILMEPFNKWLAHTGKDGVDKTPEIYTDGSFTVFDALKTDYSFLEASAGDPEYNENSRYTGGFYYPNDYIDSPNDRQQINGFWEYDKGDVSYSVFTMYASDTAKQKLYSLAGTTHPDSRGGSVKTAEAGKNYTNELDADGLGRTTLNCGKPLDDGSYVIFTYSINPDMQDLNNYNDSHPNNTYRIASFGVLEFDKGLIGGPKPTYIMGEMKKSDGLYSGYVQVFFDRSTYINRVSLANVDEGLLNGQGVQKPSTGTVTTGVLTIDSFMLNYNGDSGNVVQFPGRYFEDSERDTSNNPLTLSFKSDSDGEYVEVLWGKDTVVGTIRITESTGRKLLVEGDAGGDNPPILTLDLNGADEDKEGTLTARLNQTDGLIKSSIRYGWDPGKETSSIKTDLTLPSPDSTDSKIVVTAETPGINWITARGYGLNSESNKRETCTQDVQIIIKGSITKITKLSGTASWTPDTSGDSGTLTLPYGGTGVLPSSGTIKVQASGEDISKTARVVIRGKEGPVVGKTALADYVECKVDNKNTITVSLTSNTLPSALTGGTVTVTVGLAGADDATIDLTPNRTMTFTVNVVSAASLSSANRPSAVSVGSNSVNPLTPSSTINKNDPLAGANLGVSSSNNVPNKTPINNSVNNNLTPGANGSSTGTPSVSLSPSSVSLDMGGTKTASVKATVSNGTATKYAWTSSNSNVVTVTGSGANATLTAKSIGTATVTCTATVGGKTYTKTTAVTVTGKLTGMKLNSSGGSATLSGTTLTLKRGSTAPTATLGFTANGTINSNAKMTVLSVKDSAGKDASKYLSFTPGSNTLKVGLGSATPASATTLTVTVGIKSGSTSLTPTASSQMTFKVTVSGNDANISIGGKRP